jgi:hypothetical protein
LGFSSFSSFGASSFSSFGISLFSCLGGSSSSCLGGSSFSCFGISLLSCSDVFSSSLGGSGLFSFSLLSTVSLVCVRVFSSSFGGSSGFGFSTSFFGSFCIFSFDISSFLFSSNCEIFVAFNLFGVYFGISGFLLSSVFCLLKKLIRSLKLIF